MCVNPYMAGAGRAPAYLAGREKIIADATQCFETLQAGFPERSVIYYGLRGVGKTVLLNALEDLAGEMEIPSSYMEVSEIEGSFHKSIALASYKLLHEISKAEKAKAYNKLVDLAMAKVSKETGTITENQMAAQLGQGKVQPYDTLGLGDAICQAIDAAIECDKYDQQPDAKGKVKPKFGEKNAQRIWAVRSHLVNIGQEQARLGNNANVLKYWGGFTDSGNHPFFEAQDHKPEAEYAG